MKKGLLKLKGEQQTLYGKEKLKGLSIFSYNGTSHACGWLEGFLQSPFDQTIYLSKNCYVLRKVDSLFAVLNRYDILLTQLHDVKTDVQHNDIPSSFPFFSPDVIGITNNENSQNFLSELSRKFESNNDIAVALRETCWETNARIYILPPEWNINRKEYFDLWTDIETKLNVLNVEDSNETYRQLKRPLSFVNKLRYRWRKLKVLYWQLKQF